MNKLVLLFFFSLAFVCFCDNFKFRPELVEGQSVHVGKSDVISESEVIRLLKQKIMTNDAMTNEVMIQFILQNLDFFPLASDFPNRLQNWTECAEIPVLGKACIELYFEPESLKVGVRLIVQGRIIIDQYIQGNKVCADERTLLRLVTFIPPLIPFKPVIESILFFYGFIPANIFSLCVEARNLHIERHRITGRMFLNSTLMCFRDNCAHRGNKDFGDFEIIIPIKELKEKDLYAKVLLVNKL